MLAMDLSIHVSLLFSPYITIGTLLLPVSFAFGNSAGEFSDILENDTGFYILHLTDRKPKGTQTIEEATAQIRSILAAENQKEKAKKKGEAIKAALAGKTLDDLTGEEQSKIKTSDLFTRQGYIPGIGQDPALIGAAFRLATPGHMSTLVEGDRGYFLIQLVERQPIDEKAFESQKESLRQQLLAQKQNQLYSDWIADLKDKSDIKERINDFFTF